MKNKVFIIAEAGVNHNGDINNAFKLIDIAKKAGADAVKFQTFLPGECTGDFAIKVDYLEKSSNNEESRSDITKKLALDFSDFYKIKEYADKHGILFLTTPDGFQSLKYVNEVLDIPIIKISSTELTNLPYLEAIAKTGKKVILSTGLGNLGEIEKAINVIQPLNDDITVLHCTSEYPTPVNQVNIQAMKTINNAFFVDVGYSDHTLGYEASIMAVALGAKIVEKHFTIDKNMEGPDHQASLSPEELKNYVKSIRDSEAMLGDGKKKPTVNELKNKDGIRRSIVASKALKKGTVLSYEDLDIKRPGYGVHIDDLDKIIGLKINEDLEYDQPIEWKYFK